MNGNKDFFRTKLTDENYYGKVYEVIAEKMQILGSVLLHY